MPKRVRNYTSEQKERMAKQRRKYFVRNPWIRFYDRAKARCKGNTARTKSYKHKGIKFHLSVEDAKSLWFLYEAYNMKRPSLDRIDSDKDYSVDNCQFIEVEEHLKKTADERGHKLSHDDVITIRKDYQKYKCTATQLAKRFGICKQYVYDILKIKVYKYLPPTEAKES